MKFTTLSGTAAIAFLMATSAMAQDLTGWYLQLGPSTISPTAEIKSATAGGVDASAGAAADISSANGISAKFSYRFDNNLSVGALIGTPPDLKVTGTGGAFAGLDAGTLTAGPFIASVNYHFNPTKKFQPYVGGGLAYFAVIDSKDGMITDFSAKNAIGPAAEVGFDYWVTDNQGFFGSVIYSTADTEFTGNFGPAPIVAKATFKSLVYRLGWSYKF